MFKLFDIVLPDWTTIRREKKKIRGLLSSNVVPSVSIFKTPTYRLSLANIIAQEVANPFVSPVIEYFPQEADGKGVYNLSQSKKWLEGFEPTSRAPMCRNNGRDWFLFEPVQLNTDEVVVPVFFFMRGTVMFAKCVKPDFHSIGDGSEIRISFPSDVEFSSDNLETVKVSDFEYNCLEVIGTNGQLLSTQCRNSMFGELLLNLRWM
jgi:hypothetical protein